MATTGDHRRAGHIAVTVVGGMAIALTGCAGPSKPAARAPSSTTSSSVISPTTATSIAAGSAPSSTSALPAGPGYEAAKAQWIGEGLVGSSALQNTALDIAVVDLEHGKSTDTGKRSGYGRAISTIDAYEKLPITGVTPAQDAQGKADLTQVNAFFGLPATGSVPSCGGESGTAASAAWSGEPQSTTSGILVAPLQRAASDLKPDVRTNPCTSAAIADLANLESATSAEIAASAGATTGGKATLAGAEIAYLNEFFGAFVLSSA